MFKLVVLSAVLAVVVAAPRPGFLHSAPAAYAVSAPLATSHTSRVDIHSSPIIAAPVIAAAPAVAIAHAAPVLAAAPAVAVAHAAPAYAAIPAAVSHQARVDVHHSAAILAAPSIAYAPAVAHVSAIAPSIHPW